MSEIDDLKARLAQLEPLEKAQTKLEAAKAAHVADLSDPKAKAAYRQAASDLAAIRQAQREADIEAGIRPGVGQAAADGGVAAPGSIDATVALPQPGGAQ